MTLRFKAQTYVVNPSFELNLHLSVRRCGKQPLLGHFSPHDNLTFVELLLELEKARSLHVLPPSLRKHAEFLISSGLLVTPAEVPKVVAPDFEFSPRHLALVPAALKGDPSGLVFDTENVYLQTKNRRPETSAAGIPPEGSFPEGPCLLWVYDPGTWMWSVYRAPPAEFAIIRSAMKAQRVDRIPAELLACLVHARIVVDPAARKAQLRRRVVEIQRARTTLRREGYAVLRGVLPPMSIAIMRTYFREREANGYLMANDLQADRFVAHDDLLLQFVHRQTGTMIQSLSEQRVVPSYSYVSAYMEKAELPRHRDRAQCVWNASVLIDSTLDAPDGSGWPIFLETPAGLSTVDLAFGDMVVYSGVDRPHWRKRLRRGRQTLGLLHYVPPTFTGDLA